MEAPKVYRYFLLKDKDEYPSEVTRAEYIAAAVKHAEEEGEEAIPINFIWRKNDRKIYGYMVEVD